MYFLRYNTLKEKLRARSLSDREALSYLVLFTGLTTAATLVPANVTLNLWDWIHIGLSLILAVGGVYYSYVRNGGEHGFDLIQKFTVIGWVVTVRCLLVFIPCFFALLWIGDSFGLVADETNWFDVVVTTGFGAILYQRIGRHVADTK
jgi:hypothetical protein